MSLLTLIKAQFGKSNTPAAQNFTLTAEAGLPGGKKPRELPDYDYLHAVFEYKDGKLLWKIDKPNAKRKAGDEAGNFDDRGYRKLTLSGGTFAAHRIIYFMLTGEQPNVVDHIDGDLTNNRIENLRPADVSTNNWNAKLRKDSSTGVKGVGFDKTHGVFKAYVNKLGKRVNVGTYRSIEEATKAVISARREMHDSFANNGVTA